jgi:hypothetical protein
MRKLMLTNAPDFSYPNELFITYQRPLKRSERHYRPSCRERPVKLCEGFSERSALARNFFYLHNFVIGFGK